MGMKELVFIHGRSQQDNAPDALKETWIAAWRRGLAKSGLSVPIPLERIRFPFYGNTLRDLTAGMEAEAAAKIIVRGAQEDSAAADFLLDLLDEFIVACRIGEDEIRRNVMAADGAPVVERGAQNWPWVHAVLRSMDQHVPGSGALIGLFTRDVYLYLCKTNVRTVIHQGVGAAFLAQPDKVVVAHSLGTVIAYQMLRQVTAQAGWRVAELITLGSPLGIRAIRERLGGVRHPACVGKWFNALDPHDVVALYPLDQRNFRVTPPIENKTDVHNHTGNQHGIEGYLDDPVIARRIHDALKD